MKYTIAIEWETKSEVGDILYVFPTYSENPTLSEIQKYFTYEEKIITAIKPKLHQNIDWNWALIFEFMTWTDAYYSDNIQVAFREWSFHRVYFNKDDAEKEKQQRIESIEKRLKWFTK